MAALSGLTDTDGITLSTAQLVEENRLAPDAGWHMMLVGALANVGFKTAVVGMLGTRLLMRRVGILFGIALAGGVLLLWLWPPV